MHKTPFGGVAGVCGFIIPKASRFIRPTVKQMYRIAVYYMTAVMPMLAAGGSDGDGAV